MWAGSNNNNGSSQLTQLYTSLLSSTHRNETNLEEYLLEIRKKLDDDLILLKGLDGKIGQRSAGFEEYFKQMKEYSTMQVPLRKRTLGQIFKISQYYLLYGALAPEVFCPEKVRVGTIGDGGKWVCNPWKAPRDSVLLSLGLNNWINFEEEWQKITKNGSDMYGFDLADQNPDTKRIYESIRGKTTKALISLTSDPKSGKFTIEDLTKQSNISKIEILKIDIEGAELTCLVPFLEKFEVCQIYIEVHGGAQEHAKLLGEIAHLNYRIFSYEVNGFELKACEYSFIHESCIEKYGALRIANYLDFKH